MYKDITYCSYAGCPNKKCERHMSTLTKEDVDENKWISISDFSGICRWYIEYMILPKEVTENES